MLSHHLDPEVLRKLVIALYNKIPEFYICAVRGENFGFGEKISGVVLKRAAEAVEKIRGIVS